MKLKNNRVELDKDRLRNLIYHVGLAFIVGGVLHGITTAGPAPETAMLALVGAIMALITCAKKEEDKPNA